MNETEKQNALIAFGIIIVSTIIGIYFRPLMIIDETRYVSVAWEMWDKGSFLVPLIDGVPYHQKPPLLFWLFHIDWLLFGVNEISIRFIPMLFGLGSLVFIYKIYLSLWEDNQRGATQAMLVAAGTVVFAFYNSLIMFDVILTFFVFFGIYHIIKVTQTPSRYHFIMIAVAFGLGALTKGPVILVHLLSFILFAVYFMPKRPSKDFYIKLALSFVGGILIALAWAIPAGIVGGEAYRYAIFFGQTANRMVHSFAHQRPLWWYLMLLPLLLFPWTFYIPFYKGIRKTLFDSELKMITVWLLATLVIFSLISGKQVHYIMPEIVAFSLVFIRILKNTNTKKISTKLIGYSYLLYGIILAASPYIVSKENIYITFKPDITAFVICGILLIVTGIYFISKKFNTQNSLIRSLAFGSVILIFTAHLPIHNFLKQQDISKFANSIAKLQEQKVLVLHYAKYHDQYHFTGRLHQPLIIVNNQKEINKYTAKYPNAMIVVYVNQKDIHKVNQSFILEKTGFKGKYAILIKAKNYKAFYDKKE